METRPPNLSSPPPLPPTWGSHSAPSSNARAERKSGCRWPLILLVVFLVVAGIFVISVFGVAVRGFKKIGTASGIETNQNIEEKVIVKGSGSKIAHIDLEGIITSMSGRGGITMVEEFQLQMQKALDDDRVAAVVVRINSPGGEVTASDLLYHTMKLADAQKPVVAYMDSIAASGGYYTACGARKILAHPTTLTGSIGVIMQSINYTTLLDKIGMSMEVYKSGEFKDMLSGSRRVRPEERAYVQSMVRQTYERFLAVVSESRKKTTDTLRDSELADGRVYSGSDALASGMVDGNGYITDAYNDAMKLAGTPGASVVRYRMAFGFFDSIRLFGEAAVAKSTLKVDVSDRLLPRLEPGVAYYLHLPACGQP